MEPRRDAGDNPYLAPDVSAHRQRASMEPRRDAGDNRLVLTKLPTAAMVLQWSPGVMPGITTGFAERLDLVMVRFNGAPA